MIKKELISRVRSSRGSDAEISLDVLMMAKYLERIGDHACNVAKWVIYAITGNNEKDCEWKTMIYCVEDDKDIRDIDAELDSLYEELKNNLK